jgi:hypothetical protein
VSGEECRRGLHIMWGQSAYGGVAYRVVLVFVRLALWPMRLQVLKFLGIKCWLRITFVAVAKRLCHGALGLWYRLSGVVGRCLELLRIRRAGPSRLAFVAGVHDVSRRIWRCV